MVIIADSSGLISLFVATDRNHKVAIGIRQKLEKTPGSIYIPAEIFTETVNVVGKKINHTAAVKLAENILSIKTFLIIDSNEDARLNGLKKFKKQPGSVSFTDCLVMAFADQYETKEVFGFDEAFKKNGYVRVGIDSA